MRKLLILPVLLLIAGCTSFSTHVFRTEQVAVTAAYGAYVGYTNLLPQLNLTTGESNTIKQARIKFATSVAVLDIWRQAYETNSDTQPQVEAALSAVTANASNLVWLVQYLKAGRTP